MVTRSKWQRPSEDPAVCFSPGNPPALRSGGRLLKINVVFTTLQGTMAALKAAQELSRGLDAQTLLLVPQVVPLQFPLSSPPVSTAFIQQQAYFMAQKCTGETGINVQVYLCGNRMKCLMKALRPQSLVVLGGKKRWWRAPEEKLAQFLRRKGHRVIFVNGD